MLAFVLRQGFDNEIEAQPETPTVVVESHWKDQRHYEEQHQHFAVVGAEYEQTEEADHQDRQLGCHYVRKDRTHQEAVLTFVKRQTVGAMMPDMKRVRRNLRFATCRTTQSQTATEYSLDLFRICFQLMPHLTLGYKEPQKAQTNNGLRLSTSFLYFMCRFVAKSLPLTSQKRNQIQHGV